MTKHNERERRTGRYSATPSCDACGKPVGADYYTDDEVCGGGDGPGFYLCGRAACVRRRDMPSVDQRRALYETQRAANGGPP